MRVGKIYLGGDKERLLRLLEKYQRKVEENHKLREKIKRLERKICRCSEDCK